ncbi:hypothetical protein L1049_008850 [Liquidambar formosana]|uniref:Nuclear pore protein n=1 Tax=Liquidambar formosana TaxID=63359 RepID=A0AAP0S3M6_LIQFO
MASSPQVSSGPSSMKLVPLANEPILEKKASVYAEVVRNFNNARERGLPFKPATAFKGAYESLGLDASGGKSVSMQKIWHLIQRSMGEDSAIQRTVLKRMALVIGARCHLEWGHEKYIIDTIQSHPAQADLGGVVENLQRVCAFLWIRLRDYGVLDFDVSDVRRQPPVDTTWQQIYFCLRTGYYDEARSVALSSRVSHQFAPQLTEWITSRGMVSAETAAAASEECEKMQIDHLLRDLPALFNTKEDFLWFKLSAVWDFPGGATSVVLNEGLVPYSLDDLRVYLNKFEPSYYTKSGKDPLVYPYVLLLSIQLPPAVLYLSKETGDGGYGIDAAHISIVLADDGVLSEGSGAGQKLGLMDAFAEASSIIRQYGSVYSRAGNLSIALEYYAQAAAAVGGGQLSWTGGAGEEEVRRFLTDGKTRQQFLLEAAHQCQEAGLYDSNIFFSPCLPKRVGAFSMALDTIKKCLSEAICAFARGRLDGESRTTGFIHSGNEILETYKYYPEVSLQEREHVLEQQTMLRQLEAILSIHKLARVSHYLDALREAAKLPFLPLDPGAPDITTDVFQNLSPHVQACVPDLLKVALSCLDNVTDSDESLRALRTKIANFLTNNLNSNWPRDLYEKVARSL